MISRKAKLRAVLWGLNSKSSSAQFSLQSRNQNDNSNGNENDNIAIPLKMLKMISSFRNRGHFAATLDPLMSDLGGRISSWLPEDADKHPDVVRMLRRYPAHLDLRPFQLENASLTKKFYLGNEVKSSSGQTEWTVPELVTFMSEAYCGNAGIEFAHIDNGKTACGSLPVSSATILYISIRYNKYH